jgi:hypothetical protein
MADKKWTVLLKSAEELCAPLGDTTDAEREESRQRQIRGLKIYNQLLQQSSLQPEQKIMVLEKLYSQIPEEANEIIISWRDQIPYTKGPALNDLIDTLALLTAARLDPHQRAATAATMYNRGCIDVCYECFTNIAQDTSVPYQYRADACKYLFASMDDDLVSESQEYLFTILEDYTISSVDRYRVIASFISKSGISSFLNTSKLKVPYDEEYVYGLQSLFFYDEKNGIRERILSGQHMLKMSENVVTADEKIKIGDMLLDVARSTTYTDNERADAADVVLREGTQEQKLAARMALSDLGFAAVNAKSANIMERVKTVYSDSQNAHNDTITASIAKFIEKLISDTTIKVRPYSEVHEEIAKLVRSKKLEAKDRLAIFRALSRVQVDTATFTSYNVTIAEILVHVWIRIQLQEPGTAGKPGVKETLEDRLIQELLEMNETCSSGYSGRFINVLSAVDGDLAISYEDQICANIAGRVNAKIRDIEDESLKTRVTLGGMEGAEDEDHKIYRSFIDRVLEDIRAEMYKEFVGGKYVTVKEFDEYFAKARSQF